MVGNPPRELLRWSKRKSPSMHCAVDSSGLLMQECLVMTRFHSMMTKKLAELGCRILDPWRSDLAPAANVTSCRVLVLGCTRLVLRPERSL